MFTFTCLYDTIHTIYLFTFMLLAHRREKYVVDLLMLTNDFFTQVRRQ
jgi:hypothetical protein